LQLKGRASTKFEAASKDGERQFGVGSIKARGTRNQVLAFFLGSATVALEARERKFNETKTTEMKGLQTPILCEKFSRIQCMPTSAGTSVIFTVTKKA
jgi:hypothetical protein